MTPSYRFIALGVSLGGLAAMKSILSSLPEDFPLCMGVVQHRDRNSDEGLAALLGRACRIPVEEPHDKQPFAPGRVYIAPPDYHLLIDGDHFALSTDEPVWYARPSIDVFFESAAFAFGPSLIAAALTGSSPDGADGIRTVKRMGGTALVQEPETAVSGVLPRAALERADSDFPVDKVLPLEGIGPYLVSLCMPKVTA